MGDAEGAGYELDYIPIMDLVWGRLVPKTASQLLSLEVSNYGL